MPVDLEELVELEEDLRLGVALSERGLEGLCT